MAAMVPKHNAVVVTTRQAVFIVDYFKTPDFT
jgi:hypothetical protein